MHKTCHAGITVTCCEAPTCTANFGSRSELSVQTSALSPSDTSCCTEFQIPHPQPFSITMDNSTTGTHSVPVVGNSALESSLGVPLSQSQAWPPAPPPKAPATIEPRLGRARARSPLTETVYVERMRSEAASVYHEAAPDGAAAGAASRVMPPPPPLQSPPDMGLIGPHNHYTRTRWAEWRDEFGRRWRISGVAVQGDLIHECWTVVEPDPAIERIFSERLGPYIPALSTRVSGRRN